MSCKNLGPMLFYEQSLNVNELTENYQKYIEQNSNKSTTKTPTTQLPPASHW